MKLFEIKCNHDDIISFYAQNDIFVYHNDDWQRLTKPKRICFKLDWDNANPKQVISYINSIMQKLPKELPLLNGNMVVIKSHDLTGFCVSTGDIVIDQAASSPTIRMQPLHWLD